MNHRLTCALAAVSLLAACASTPPLTEKNLCMTRALKGISNAKNTFTFSEFNETSTQRCSTYATLNDMLDSYSRQAQQDSNALISNTIIIGNSKVKTRSDLYNECMSKSDGTISYAPPAHLGFGKALFAIKSTPLQSCPAEFNQVFNEFVEAYERQYKYIQRLGSVSTGYINEISNRGLPTNETEKTILNNANAQFESHKKVKAVFDKLRD
jgi:hypothetical protein